MLPILYDLAHVGGWEPHLLHDLSTSITSEYLYGRICTAVQIPHNIHNRRRGTR